jgi:hypothetical protein
MHGCFWNMVAFDIFVASKPWSSTAYVLCGHMYVLDWPVCECVCVYMCVHTYQGSGKEDMR